MKRKQVGKGLRFDIFRRDGFTCQYCGRTPPDIVLQIDHIRPVADGGDNDEMNLITACSDCNVGKSAKRLDKPQRPDADLAYLEAQQQIAELRRYQQAAAERDRVSMEVVPLLQDVWCDCSGLQWHPGDHIVLELLSRYGPQIVESAFKCVAPKCAGGYVSSNGGKWLKYLRATARNMAVEAVDAT